jgi:hypothetical protein
MQEVSGSSPLSSTLVAPHFLLNPTLFRGRVFYWPRQVPLVLFLFGGYSTTTTPPRVIFILAEVGPLRNRWLRPSRDFPYSIDYSDRITGPTADAVCAKERGAFLPGAILPSAGTSQFDIDEIRRTFLIGGTVVACGCLTRRKLLFFMIDLCETRFWSLREPLGRRVVSANE